MRSMSVGQALALTHTCVFSFFRSAYCAASVASLTNIITPKLFENTTNWILRYSSSPHPFIELLRSISPKPRLLSTEFTGCCFCGFSCQNWEGGLSGVPGLEAHGGYTFCGTAALVILGKEHMLDLKSLLVRKCSRLTFSPFIFLGILRF